MRRRSAWGRSIAAQVWLMVVVCAVVLVGLILVSARAEVRNESADVSTTLARQGRALASTLADGASPEGSTTQTLSGLKPAFEDEAVSARFPQINWVVTAGNASQISDGAAAVLIMERSKAEQLSLTPRAAVPNEEQVRFVAVPRNTPVAYELDPRAAPEGTEGGATQQGSQDARGRGAGVGEDRRRAQGVATRARFGRFACVRAGVYDTHRRDGQGGRSRRVRNELLTNRTAGTRDSSDGGIRRRGRH